MRVTTITLAYDQSLRGFPQEPLDRALSEGGLLETRVHFFVRNQGFRLVSTTSEGKDTKPSNPSRPVSGESRNETPRPPPPVSLHTQAHSGDRAPFAEQLWLF